MNQKISVFGRLYFQTYTHCQMGEDGGRGFYPGNPSPTSIRNGARSSEKNQVQLRSYLKYHVYQLRCMI